VQSDDDVHWSSEHGTTKNAGNFGLGDAKRKMHEKLRSQIRAALAKTLIERAAPDRQRALAALTAGNDLEADDGFFTEWLIVSPADDNPANVRDHFIEQHHMTWWDLIAAVDAEPLPKALFEEPTRIELPQVGLELPANTESVVSEALNSQVAKSQVMLSFAAGVSSVSPNAANASSSYGGAAAFGVMFHKLDEYHAGGMRFGGGVDQHGTGYVDVDFLFGPAIHPVDSLSLALLAGVGGDFTPGGDEMATDQRSLFVAPGGYAEYGARLAYAAPRAASIEAIYTKAFRTSTRTAAETRLDGRLVLTLPGGFPMAATLRYAEYLPDVTGLFTAFGESTRAARQGWLLLGVGF
jgi:hypothetical protein